MTLTKLLLHAFQQIAEGNHLTKIFQSIRTEYKTLFIQGTYRNKRKYKASKGMTYTQIKHRIETRVKERTGYQITRSANTCPGSFMTKR